MSSRRSVKRAPEICVVRHREAAIAGIIVEIVAAVKFETGVRSGGDRPKCGILTTCSPHNARRHFKKRAAHLRVRNVVKLSARPLRRQLNWHPSR